MHYENYTRNASEPRNSKIVQSTPSTSGYNSAMVSPRKKIVTTISNESCSRSNTVDQRNCFNSNNRQNINSVSSHEFTRYKSGKRFIKSEDAFISNPDQTPKRKIRKLQSTIEQTVAEKSFRDICTSLAASPSITITRTVDNCEEVIEKDPYNASSAKRKLSVCSEDINLQSFKKCPRNKNMFFSNKTTKENSLRSDNVSEKNHNTKSKVPSSRIIEYSIPSADKSLAAIISRVPPSVTVFPADKFHHQKKSGRDMPSSKLSERQVKVPDLSRNVIEKSNFRSTDTLNSETIIADSMTCPHCSISNLGPIEISEHYFNDHVDKFEFFCPFCLFHSIPRFVTRLGKNDFKRQCVRHLLSHYTNSHAKNDLGNSVKGNNSSTINSTETTDDCDDGLKSFGSLINDSQREKYTNGKNISIDRDNNFLISFDDSDEYIPIKNAKKKREFSRDNSSVSQYHKLKCLDRSEDITKSHMNECNNNLPQPHIVLKTKLSPKSSSSSVQTKEFVVSNFYKFANQSIEIKNKVPLSSVSSDRMITKPSAPSHSITTPQSNIRPTGFIYERTENFTRKSQSHNYENDNSNSENASSNTASALTYDDFVTPLNPVCESGASALGECSVELGCDQSLEPPLNLGKDSYAKNERNGETPINTEFPHFLSTNAPDPFMTSLSHFVNTNPGLANFLVPQLLQSASLLGNPLVFPALLQQFVGMGVSTNIQESQRNISPDMNVSSCFSNEEISTTEKATDHRPMIGVCQTLNENISLPTSEVHDDPSLPSSNKALNNESSFVISTDTGLPSISVGDEVPIEEHLQHQTMFSYLLSYYLDKESKAKFQS